MAGSGYSWDNHMWDKARGIEISSLIHSYAVEKIIQMGIESRIVLYPRIILSGYDAAAPFQTKICFHLGEAFQIKTIICEADIIFCYSTVFDDNGFGPDIDVIKKES